MQCGDQAVNALMVVGGMKTPRAGLDENLLRKGISKESLEEWCYLATLWRTSHASPGKREESHGNSSPFSGV